MRTFKSLQELVDYIPQCILCNKDMPITINASLSAALPAKKYASSEHVNLKTEIKDGVARSKNKKYSLSVELATNKIIDGIDLVNRMQNSWTYVNKCCPTCHFKISTVYGTNAQKKEHCFPALTLQNEELSYTLKRGRRVFISKRYYDHNTQQHHLASIRLDQKYLPEMPLDFAKFTGLTQLNHRLATLITFH